MMLTNLAKRSIDQLLFMCLSITDLTPLLLINVSFIPPSFWSRFTVSIRRSTGSFPVMCWHLQRSSVSITGVQYKNLWITTAESDTNSEGMGVELRAPTLRIHIISITPLAPHCQTGDCICHPTSPLIPNRRWNFSQKSRPFYVITSFPGDAWLFRTVHAELAPWQDSYLTLPQIFDLHMIVTYRCCQKTVIMYRCSQKIVKV